ncbi:hypothetical protein BKA80DRAFT_278729 [Phyllosticta citrichinensis]
MAEDGTQDRPTFLLLLGLGLFGGRGDFGDKSRGLARRAQIVCDWGLSLFRPVGLSLLRRFAILLLHYIHGKYFVGVLVGLGRLALRPSCSVSQDGPRLSPRFGLFANGDSCRHLERI